MRLSASCPETKKALHFGALHHRKLYTVLLMPQPQLSFSQRWYRSAKVYDNTYMISP